MSRSKVTTKLTSVPLQEHKGTTSSGDPTGRESNLGDRVKLTLYLPDATHTQVLELARTRQSTTNATLLRLIDRALQYPDNESIRSIKSDIVDLKDILLMCITNGQSSINMEVAELQRTTDAMLWAVSTVLIGRMKAGDFGGSPEEQRARRAELDSLIETYIQHRVPNAVARIRRSEPRH